MVKRSNLLDIIKGLMILFIITTHFRFAYPEDYMKFGFFYWIDMAVPVFMIITGNLMAVNSEKRNISIRQAYLPETLITKMMRFLIPFIPVVLIEVPILITVKSYGVYDVIKCIIEGGYGPGSYYTPIMIQMIFLGPLIHYIIKKYDVWGFVICYIITGVWEAISYSCGIGNNWYRLLAFRYISLFAFGCFIAIGKKKLNGVVLTVMFIIGVVWQTLLNYVPLQPPFMNNAWARVNLYSSLFVLPIMYILIKKYSESGINVPVLQELGKASYNIFLVQMLFYGCGPAQIIYKLVGNEIAQFGICILSCISIGYVYYRIENPITKIIVEKIHIYFGRKSITLI